MRHVAGPEKRLQINGLHRTNLLQFRHELGVFPDFPIADQGKPMADVVYSAILYQFTDCRAAGLLASTEGRVRVCRLCAMLADSLQRFGVNVRPLWDMADTLGGA